MFVRLQLMIEMFVILRVLFNDDRISYHQIRQPVSGHSAVDVYLILVLQGEKLAMKPTPHGT